MNAVRPTVYYGDSITWGIARAEGSRAINLGIVGAGLISNANLSASQPENRDPRIPDRIIADADLARVGNMFRPDMVPANHPIVFSCSWNDIATVLRTPRSQNAKEAAQRNYENLLTDRLVELAGRANGQPVTVLGLQDIRQPSQYDYTHAEVEAMNRLLARAAERAEQRVPGSNIQFQDLQGLHPRYRNGTDMLHFNADGGRKIARVVRGEESIRETGASRSASPAPPAQAGAFSQQQALAEGRAIQQALAGAGFDPGGVDGVVGRKTIEALQRALAAHGYDPQGVDGTVGANTRAAIRAFEAEHSRPEKRDGALDAAEVRALVNLPLPPRSPQGRA